MTQDMLSIDGIQVQAIIGVHPWEKKIKQTLVVDIQIPSDFSKISDELDQVIDYVALVSSVESFFEAHTFNLIETAADRLAMHLMNTLHCAAIDLTISKPGAVRHCKNVSVRVQRTQPAEQHS